MTTFLINTFWQSILISALGIFFLFLISKSSAPLRSRVSMSIFASILLLSVINIIPDRPVFKKVNMDTGVRRLQNDFRTILLAPQQNHQAKIAPSKDIPAKLTATEKTDHKYQYVSYVIPAFYAIWSIGSIIMLLRLIHGLIFLNGFRYGLKSVKDQRILDIFRQTKNELNIKKKISVYVSPKTVSPISIGVFSPVIVIPENAYEILSYEEYKSIALHEMSHIKCNDHLGNICKRLIIAIFWWNPILYKISKIHDIAREEICDNYAITQLDSSLYSRCLLNMMEKNCLISQLPATACMAGNHINFKDRIISILSSKRNIKMKCTEKSKIGIALSAILSIIVVSGISCNYTGSKDAPADKKNAALKVDQKLTEPNDKAMNKLYNSGKHMSQDEVNQRFNDLKNKKHVFPNAALLLGYYKSKNPNKDVNAKNQGRIIVFECIKYNPRAKCLDFIAREASLFYMPKAKMFELWNELLSANPHDKEIAENAINFSSSLNNKIKLFSKIQENFPQNAKLASMIGLEAYSKAKHAEKNSEEFKHYSKLACLQLSRTFELIPKMNRMVLLPYLIRAQMLAGDLQGANKNLNTLDKLSVSTLSRKLRRWSRPMYFARTAKFQGLSLRGLVALQQGDVKQACKYFNDACKLENGIEIQMHYPELAIKLIKAGKKEYVISVLEKMVNNPKTSKQIIYVGSRETPRKYSDLFKEKVIEPLKRGTYGRGWHPADIVSDSNIYN